MPNRLLALLTAAPLFAIAAPALAADLSVDQPVAVQAVQEGWIVTLKATGVITPKFEGADKYGFSVKPGISIRRPGQPWKFGAPDDGFGFAVINTPWLQFGPVGRVRSERDSSDVHSFRGLDNIHWGIEPGAFVEVYPLETFRIRGELRHGVYGHHGFVGNISADWIDRLDRWTLSAGPRMELGDHKFMDTYFGVSASEAADNGRVSSYNAGGGIKSVGFATAATYDWTETWSTTAYGGYNRLVGNAADSPVAKKLGTKGSFTAGLGVAYSFGVNW